MRPDRFLPQTWFDARLVPAPSPIHGTGLFASAAFDVGEVLMVWAGSVWTRAKLDAGDVVLVRRGGRPSRPANQSVSNA
jgi:hypothetical protein